MERRRFLRTGLALGAGSGLLTLPSCARRPAARAAPVAPSRGTNGPIRLNSNENPLGLSPAARQAVLQDLGQARWTTSP